MKAITIIALVSSAHCAKLTKIPGIDADKWYENTGKKTWGSSDVSRKFSGNFYRKFRSWNQLYNTDRAKVEDPIRFKSFE